MDPEDFDPEQLEAGTRHELEHTSDREIAREIAMDHLAEHRDYYRYLGGMERRMEKGMEPNRKWTAKYVNSLPDESFLWVDPETGERKLPYADREGEVDVAHLRNALSRLSQTDLPSERVRDKIRERAQRLLARHGGYQANESDEDYGFPERGSLSSNTDVLCDLVEMEAESMGKRRFHCDEVPETVRTVAQQYDEAVWKALHELVKNHPPDDSDIEAEDIWHDGDAPYLILMTLRGEGIGIWDGSWRDFYDEDRLERRGDVAKFLRSRLQQFADDTGSGELNLALSEAVEDD